MLAGAGLIAPPAMLHTSIGKGINLDDPDWQEAVIAQAVAASYRLVTLDPIRSLSAAADQGSRATQATRDVSSGV